MPFRLGFIINPYAGAGGPAAFKGSDGDEIRQAISTGKIKPVAQQRAAGFLTELSKLQNHKESMQIITVRGSMGGDVAALFEFPCQILPLKVPQHSTAEHTQQAAIKLQAEGVDLLIFVGGDGTARDVCSVVNSDQTVLGVPSGVKMHSGVFAINPQSAAALVARWSQGNMVDVKMQEVRDIDEPALRQGKVKSRFFGEMLTPEPSQYMQNVKQGGIEQEELVLLDIADDLKERIPDNALIVWGSGSTTHQIAQNWSIDSTLLGVDLLLGFNPIAMDANRDVIENALLQHQGDVYVVVTAIGGQGHIFGRGNQQISPQVLRRAGKSNIIVVASKTKLATLSGRPLLLDTGDSQLDQQWAGFITVTCGYHHQLKYPLGS